MLPPRLYLVGQSYSALAVEPPCPREYFRPLILWGPAIVIFFVWTIVGELDL